jgi:16S rRNA (adenine1518-N6/adenine1519-N6)-dimethyltransferase
MKNVVAKKKFGQNFLKDESVLHEIIQAMPTSDRDIAEIGPGLGDLTRYLVKVKSVTAFEVDTDLCKHLQKEFNHEITTNSLTLECGDVLENWQSELLDRDYDLVANLPYYIATTIILKALADPNCHNILVMVQKEVALKFAANVKEKVFSALAVITQSLGHASIVVEVPPTAFEPQPKVDSAVLLIRKKSSRLVTNSDNSQSCSEEFEQMLRVAFTQPRKTLLKNLSQKYNKSDVLEIFKTLDFSLTIRPHEVCTKDYHQLYKSL